MLLWAGDSARGCRAARHGPRPLHRRPRRALRRRPARAPGAGTARARPGHGTAHRTRARRPRRRAGPHRRRRSRRQRRRREVRRAALPERGDVPRARRVLGARGDARGRPPGLPRRGGRLRAAAGPRRAARGDRGRQLPGWPADDGARGRRGGVRPGRARVQRRARARRPGALLPRDALLPRARRRVRPGVRPEQHAAPHRDPGHRRARPRGAEPRGDRPVPADGRGLRGQGDAAARVRRRRRPRRAPHRPPRAAAPQPGTGHDDDRQAARLPHPVARRLRRRRAAPCPRRDAHLRRRVEPRPLRAGPRPGPVPRRQRLLDPPRPGARQDRPDAQDLPDGLPGVRRAPGDARHRGRHRPVRPPPRGSTRPTCGGATSTPRDRPPPTASRCGTRSAPPAAGTGSWRPGTSRPGRPASRRGTRPTPT